MISVNRDSFSSPTTVETESALKKESDVLLLREFCG